jgi:type I restriction enzyme S subunit
VNTAELQDFCKFVQGGRHKLSGKHFVETGFPAYGAGGLNGYLPEAEFNRDGVVLSAIGARCGKCFLAQGRWSSLANTQIILPDLKRADVRFLWYQLNDETRWPRHGLAQPFIRPSDVKAHRVVLPPLPEQRRISAILDKADALRRKRKRAIGLLDNLTHSMFLEMFGNLDRYRTITVDQSLLTPLRNGLSLAKAGTFPGKILGDLE